MRSISIAACSILAACGARAAAPIPGAPAKPCAERLVSYREWPRLEAAGEIAWSLDVAATSGARLVYLGAEHASDPAHPQFAEIDRQWAALRPTVAFYEGPDRPIAATRDETIRATGESGYVRFLARRDGIPALRLDPDAADELAFVRARHPGEQVALFYVLREVVRLRDRKGVSAEALPGAVGAMLARAAELGLPGAFDSVGAFEAAYRAQLGEPAAWTDAPAAWFSPLPPRDQPERFTHRINRDSSELRNRHMFEQLTARVRAGDRVLAVVGRNHVPMQAPALRCAIQ